MGDRTIRRIQPALTFVAVSVIALAACGGSDEAQVQGDNTPYTSDPNKTVVVGGASGATNAQAGASGSGCVTLPDGRCVEAKGCAEGERRDVIIDSSGKVVDVVCYPASSDPPVIDSNGNVTLDKNQNNGVVAIDGANDGVDIAGDVTAAGNNVTVYGEGPDVSVIGGNVGATGNNFAMRGVTVKGNVEVSGNNAVLVLCAVEGNIRIVGNNNVIADCDVLGNIVIEGVNNTLVANHVGGTISVSETKNLVCDGNTKWNDANTNKVFDAGEAGAALECTNKK
jgi:hypothetical protein